MQAAALPDPIITGPMTWAEICQRYPESWVCLVEMEWGDPRRLDIRRGRVVGHAKTRRELDEQTRDVRDPDGHVGRYFTGELEVVMLSPLWLT